MKKCRVLTKVGYRTFDLLWLEEMTKEASSEKAMLKLKSERKMAGSSLKRWRKIIPSRFNFSSMFEDPGAEGTFQEMKNQCAYL